MYFFGRDGAADGGLVNGRDFRDWTMVKGVEETRRLTHKSPLSRCRFAISRANVQNGLRRWLEACL